MYNDIKLFTLLELIFVIGIISLLFLVFSNFNTSREQEKILNARSCVNSVVWKLNNYLNYAFTSKLLYTGWNKIYPDKYIIEIKPKYFIYLKYYYNNTGLYEIIDLKDALFKSYGCEGVYFSGNYYKIILYKGFTSDLYHWWFEIYENWLSKVEKGYLNFYFTLTWYRQRLIWKLEINSIAKKMFYYDCVIWSWWDLLNCKKFR